MLIGVFTEYTGCFMLDEASIIVQTYMYLYIYMFCINLLFCLHVKHLGIINKPSSSYLATLHLNLPFIVDSTFRLLTLGFIIEFIRFFSV